MVPGDLEPEELQAIVEGIIDVLWPRNPPDHDWNADTLDQIVQTLDEYHLVPPDVRANLYGPG